MVEPARTKRSAGEARGFTLLELLIVLAVLVLLVAIAWPALRRPLLSSVTHEAAQQLVQDVAAARLIAIESGRTLAMRFEPGGSRYEFSPAEPGGENERSGAGDGSDVVAEMPEGGYDPLAGLQAGHSLDDDVVFGDPLRQHEEDAFGDSTLGDTLRDEMRETQEVQPLLEIDRPTIDSWSLPILLFPTGRTENAEFLLEGPGGECVTVTLRGLTVALTLGKPFRITVDEQPREDH